MYLPYANPTEVVMEILKCGPEVVAILGEEVIKRLIAALEKIRVVHRVSGSLAHYMGLVGGKLKKTAIGCMYLVSVM